MPPPFVIDETLPQSSNLLSQYPGQSQSFRAVVEEWLTFISDPATGALKGVFPAGTKMIFNQTAAPTLWTKDVTHNNKAMRIVNGTASSGGTVAFTTAFASQAVAGTNTGTAITAANLPAHTHTFSDTATSGTQSVDHTHGVNINSGVESALHSHSIADSGGGAGTSGLFASAASGSRFTSTESVSHTHNVAGNTGGMSLSHTHSVTVSGTTSSVGSGTTHTHTFTGTAINLAVQYVDMIIATKD